MPSYTVQITRPALETVRYHVELTDQALDDCGYETDVALLAAVDGHLVDGAAVEVIDQARYTRDRRRSEVIELAITDLHA